MTSLFRELVREPIVVSRSMINVSRPVAASARAIASPITPAPITTHSQCCMSGRRHESADRGESRRRGFGSSEPKLDHRQAPQSPADDVLLGQAETTMQLNGALADKARGRSDHG